MWEFLQVDVFARRAGTGNPLAVIRDDGRLDTEQMQAIAAWTNLAETTFLSPPSDPKADYRIRIFTARQEIAFAGHPSIGSAHAAMVTGLASPRDGALVQECLGGLLPIRAERHADGEVVAVRVPRSRMVRHASAMDQALHRALQGRTLGASPPALVEGGRRWWLAELAGESEVRGMHPDRDAIGELAAATDSLGLCVFARSGERGDSLVVRAFPLGVNIDEDPASGAANAAIAAYLDETTALGALGREYVVSQGRELGRDAELFLRLDDERQVWVGGRCLTVIRGRMDW